VGNCVSAKEGIVYDVVIVGGGPAGMTAAVYSGRKNLDTALISRDLGGQALWSLEIQNYMGYQYITGQELMDKFREQMLQFPVEQHLGEDVAVVSAGDPGFIAETRQGGRYHGRTVIIATGKRPRPLDVPGEKELIGRGVSYCATCDGPLFRDLEVAVIGGGFSALAAAADLAKVARSVHLIHAGSKWQATPPMVERALRSDKVHPRLGHTVAAVRGDGAVSGITLKSSEGETQELAVQGVFVETGLIPSSECVAGLVGLNHRREILVDSDAKTSRRGVYAAGDVTSVPAKQIVVAAGDGAKAALGAHDFLLRERET
jgi:alkyl hydroperoxide reductase subunit F